MIQPLLIGAGKLQVVATDRSTQKEPFWWSSVNFADSGYEHALDKPCWLGKV